MKKIKFLSVFTILLSGLFLQMSRSDSNEDISEKSNVLKSTNSVNGSIDIKAVQNDTVYKNFMSSFLII